MNKKALAEIISNKIEGVNKNKANDIIELITETVTSELQKGNEVTLAGFGTFLSRTRHARNGVNPRNPQQMITIPEVKVAKFKTGKNLKDALKSK
ncbi:MAG: HU family DNA-binding protein [Candidatus Pacebacteria bacterium]|nr:HU family DNA-binding protein [Candidatus Paceibacterota bacterium]